MAVRVLSAIQLIQLPAVQEETLPPTSRTAATGHQPANIGRARDSQAGWPKFGANLNPLIQIISQHVGPICKIWANPVSFTLRAKVEGWDGRLLPRRVLTAVAVASGGGGSARDGAGHDTVP